MMWTARPDEVTALGSMLDRTYAEVAEAGHRPSTLDRPRLLRQLDLWTDHLLPAVAAANAPLRTRRAAGLSVWHTMHASDPDSEQWLRTNVATVPAFTLGPQLTRLVDAQLHLIRRLQTMRRAENVRRWELAAIGGLCAGLGTDTIRIATALARSEHAAERRLQTLLDATLSALPAAPGPRTPSPQRITVGTAATLFAGLDVTRLRLLEHTDRTVLHLEAHRPAEARDTLVVLVLTDAEDPKPLDIPEDGITLTAAPQLTATADDIDLTLPLTTGEWTVQAAAGTCYTD
jgi:hypothetical protein